MKNLIKSYIYIYISVAVLIGCSNSEQNQKISYKNLSAPASVDFGIVLEKTSSPIKSIIIINNENETKQILPIISNAQFQILYSSCSSLRPGKSCSLKVLMKTDSAGEKSASLDLGDLSISLQGEVDALNLVSEIKIYENNTETDLVNFGVVAKSSIKTMVIVNDGDRMAMAPVISLSNNEFSIISNTCSKALKKNESCSLKVSFSSQGKNSGVKASVLDVDGSLVDLSAEVGQSGVAIPDSLAFFDDGNEVTTIDLGEIPNKLIKTIIIKNKNAIPSTPLSVNLDSGHYIKIYDTCSGKSLKGNEACLVKIYIENKPDGNYPLNLSVNGENLAIEGAIGYRLASIEVSSATNLLVNGCHEIGVALKNPSGGDFIPEEAQVISSSLGLYSDSNCTVSANSFEEGVASRTFYINPEDVGSTLVNVSIGAISGNLSVNIYEDISFSNQSITVVNTATLSAVGGIPPYSFSKVSGVGTVSGVSFDSEVEGAAVIRVEDSLGNFAIGTITVNPQLTISLGSCSSAKESLSCTPSVAGGVGPLSYSVDRGTIVNSSTGENYSYCDGDNCVNTITVEDSIGNLHSANFSLGKVYTSCSNVAEREISPSNSQKYDIDFDGYRIGEPLMSVWCDFTTAGGPYLVVISPTLSLSATDQRSNLLLLGNNGFEHWNAPFQEYRFYISTFGYGVEMRNRNQYYILKSHIPLVSGNRFVFHRDWSNDSENGFYIGENDLTGYSNYLGNMAGNSGIRNMSSMIIDKQRYSNLPYWVNGVQQTNIPASEGPHVSRTAILNEKVRYMVMIGSTYTTYVKEFLIKN